MKPSKKEFPLKLFGGMQLAPGMTFTTHHDDGSSTSYRVDRVNPMTHMVECTRYAPSYMGFVGESDLRGTIPACAHPQKTETGFGTAYCKTCPAKFKYVDFNWVKC